MKLIVAIGLLFFGGSWIFPSGFAQSVNSKDYLVTLEGDTVYGFIQTLSDSKINIAHESKNSMVVKKYKINALKCVVMKDTIYKGVKINPPNVPSSIVLMKELQNGSIGLYQREIRKTKMWNANDDQDFSGIVGKVLQLDYYLLKNGKSYKIKEDNFGEICPQIFYDQEWIKKKFMEGKYKFQNLDQLVMDYNYLVLNPLEN